MISKALIGIATLALISSLAIAGKVVPLSVVVHVEADGSGYAEGDMATARTSENEFELIGCGIKGFAIENPWPFSDALTVGFCQARNSDNENVFCITESPILVEVLKATGDFSYIYFEFDESGYCTRIDFSTQSVYLPKNIKANKVP